MAYQHCLLPGIKMWQQGLVDPLHVVDMCLADNGVVDANCYVNGCQDRIPLGSQGINKTAVVKRVVPCAVHEIDYWLRGCHIVGTEL